MPAKGSFSHIIEPNKFVDPMDLNVLLKGTMYKEDIAKNNLQDLQSSYQQLASIPAYGEDAKILQGKLEELKNNVSQMKLGNLSDYNTSAQIKGVVNNFASDPVLNDIAQRWTPYEKELKKKEEAEAKGNIYLSPIIDNGNKYIQKGEYIQGKNLGGSGWIGANYQKLKKEALENVQKVKKYTTKNGMVHETESYDEDALKQTITALYNDPRIKRDLEFNLSKSLEEQDSNFTEYGRNFVKNQILTAYQAMQLNPNDSKAQEYIDSYSDLLENDVSLEEIGRTQMIQEEIDKNIQNDIKTSQFISEGRPKIDDIYSKNLDFNHKLQEDIFKLRLKTGLSQNQGESQADYIKRLAEKAQEKDLELASAKQDIKTEAQLKLEEEKQKNKLEVIKVKGENLKIKSDGNSKILLGGKERDKRLIKEAISKENTEIISEVLKEFAPTFGLDKDKAEIIDPGSLYITTDSKGVKWVEYQNDLWVENDDNFKTPLTEIIKYVYDSDMIPVVYKNNEFLTGNLEGIDKSNVEKTEEEKYELD